MKAKSQWMFIGLLFLGAVGFILWQQQRIRQLEAELAAWRGKFQQAADGASENSRLRDDLKSADDRTQTQLKELVRLRAEATRLRNVEAENAKMKAVLTALTQKQTAGQQASGTSTGELPEDQTEEQKLRWAYGGFGRDLAMSLIEARDDNDHLPDEFTNEVLAKSSYLRPKAETYSHYGLVASQFERVYKGSWRALKDSGNTILVRQKQPTQLSDGRWMKVYGFGDGHSQQVFANSPDGFAAKEKEFGFVEDNP